MRTIILTLISFSLFVLGNAQELPLKTLSQQLEKLAGGSDIHKIFIKTEKDVYAPGEKIWFKAEVMNIFSQKPIAESSLVVMIKTEGGDIIADRMFIVQDGVATGQLTVPGWASEGNAYLIAHNPNAPSTNDASLTGIKPITVNQLRRNDYLVEAVTDKALYKPNEEVKLQLMLKPLTPSARKERVSVTLFDYYKRVYSTKENLTVGEIKLLKFKIPSDVENGLYFVIELSGKTGFSRRVPVYTTKDQLNIEFFIEGTNLLLNNNQRIIYRASDPFGNLVDVAGDIYDEAGTHAGTGRTLKKGLGIINLMPLPAHEYTFKIGSEYGKGQKFELPLATSNGTAFTLIKTEDNAIRAAVINSGGMVGKTLTLAAVAKGSVWMSQEFVAEQKNSFQISTDGLPLGAINFIVMDKNGEIVSERLVFNYPNKDMDISIGTVVSDTSSEKLKEVAFDLNNFVNQFGEATFDIKIVDIQNLYPEQTDLQYNFLEYPLFTPTPKNMLDHYIVNIEMIANRYSHFSLRDVMNKVDLSPKNKTNTLSGYVTDKNGQRVAGATVIVVLPDNPSVSTTLTDKNGEFNFQGLLKSKDMLVKAVNETGKRNYTVHLHRSLHESLEEILLYSSFRSFVPYQSTSTQNYFAHNEHLLKLAGSETKDRKPAETPSTVKMLHSGVSLLDVIRMIKPFTITDNKIIFVGGMNSILMQDGALFVIDGQKMGTNISALEMVNPYDVVSVNVSTYPVDIQQYTAFNTVGIVEINTRGNSSLSRISKTENEVMNEISSFNADEIPNNIFRYQTTLYWETGAMPDNDGKINRTFMLSDLKTDFVIQIEAVSADGITHRETAIVSTKD
jgi:hypothetical protein